MRLFLFIFLVYQSQAFGKDICGETWNTSWAIETSSNKITRLDKKFFPEKYCEPAPPINSNTLFQILDDSKRVTFSKEIFVAFDAYFDDLDPKTKKFEGGVTRPKKVEVIVKFPRTEATIKGKYVRFLNKSDKRVLGMHEL
ncbi:MAG: hypothetical protein ACAH59_02535 [Pseudobdellovibrionaceae bacterium]